MGLRFADFTYSEKELEHDAIHYLKDQVYEPSYADKVKAFIAEDAADFKRNFDDEENIFLNLFYDEYRSGYVPIDDNKISNTNFQKLTATLDKVMQRYDVPEDEIEHYAFMLDAEFRKNAFCSHMEPYFAELDAVFATVMVGYSRNPLFSIYSIAREWCMALHMKKMHPSMFRRFGYQYQCINYQFTGEERLRRLVDFKDKYQHTFKNIGILRAIHSSVFAYAYIYLKAVLTKEVITAENFIMDSSSSKVTLLLQAESITNFDFPVTKYVLDKLKSGMYEDFLTDDGRINWNALYIYTFNAIKEAGFEGVHFFGFDSIEAKTMRSFWNKSSSMQSMLKILRKLALENNNPVFNRLIEGCEYRLGRPDKAKEKMEQFIEDTRRIMAARSYELTKPRTMAQELISAFPSVFLVYFQWHHNFRNIYPKFPEREANKKYEQQVKLKQNAQPKEIAVKQADKWKPVQENGIKDVVKTSNTEDKLRAILENKQRTMAEMSQEKLREQQQTSNADKALRTAEMIRRMNQNS